MNRGFTSILRFDIHPSPIFNSFYSILIEVLNHLNQIEFLNDLKRPLVSGG